MVIILEMNFRCGFYIRVKFTRSRYNKIRDDLLSPCMNYTCSMINICTHRMRHCTSVQVFNVHNLYPQEEALYKYPVSKFTEVDEITSSIDPFMRLFQVVFKWQRAEKKYVIMIIIIVWYL